MINNCHSNVINPLTRKLFFTPVEKFNYLLSPAIKNLCGYNNDGNE
jgi:hypothetical protein